MHIDTSWGGGFNATVTVTNTSTTSATKAWSVSWAWPSGQSVASMWNAVSTASGSTETATNEPYNGAIAASGSVSFGFQGNGSSATPPLTCTAS